MRYAAADADDDARRSSDSARRALGGAPPGPAVVVLDVGSGTGLLAEHVAGLVGPTGKVLGIDPLPLRVQIAQQKAKANLSFQVGNAYALDGLPSGSFDVVYLNAVFHWLPEKTESLRQSHRLLKPGGRIGLTTGAKDHPNRLQAIKREVLSREPYARYPESRDGRLFAIAHKPASH
ncbi:class I SAM-dependent methyltransferase [Sorangium sp. So ce295]|uniref:class I SAM-dependent methyltransferase n=1 Tax=Sorangium sp. So ce295 TaxID=3133295 RepID=UPI003F5F3566